MVKRNLAVQVGDVIGRGITAEGTDELLTAVDDLLLLAEVIEAGGFRPAAERTGITRSRLSRRIAALEERLGVPLIVRSSRHFETTEMGRRFYEHGRQIRMVTRSALTLAEDSGDEPSGVLRVACPFALSQAVVTRLAIAFSQAHPKVRLCLTTTKGTHETLHDHYDLVIHPSTQQLPDSGAVARLLLTQEYLIVGAPTLAAGREQCAGPSDLEGLSAIGWNSSEPIAAWRLFGPDGAETELQLPVRFAADNLLAVRDAALAGLGVARLPVATCAEDLRQGRLKVLVPGWAPAPMSIYVLYPSRRTLSLAGQRFVGVLKQALEALPDNVAVQTRRTAA